MNRFGLKFALRATMAACLSAGLGGCGIVNAERTYSGGWINQQSDIHLMKADSKPLRVVRAAAILRTLVEVGTHTGGKSGAMATIMTQAEIAARDIGVAFEIAQSGGSNFQASVASGQYDYNFDQAMEVVQEDLFILAKITLPEGDMKKVLSDIETGSAWAIFDSLTTVLWDIAVEGRVYFAGYRDLMDAWGGFIVKNSKDASCQSQLDLLAAAYNSGNGNLADFGTKVDTYLACPKHNPLDITENNFKPSLIGANLSCSRVMAWNSGQTAPPFCDAVQSGFRDGRTNYQTISTNADPSIKKAAAAGGASGTTTATQPPAPAAAAQQPVTATPIN